MKIRLKSGWLGQVITMSDPVRLLLSKLDIPIHWMNLLGELPSGPPPIAITVRPVSSRTLSGVRRLQRRGVEEHRSIKPQMGFESRRAYCFDQPPGVRADDKCIG